MCINVFLFVLPVAVSIRADPLIGMDQILPVSEVRPGMRGVGKTVFSGMKVEEFKITVVGVLEKIDFGADMILIRVDSGPVVSKGFGIVAGMSGSPIYIGKKLIGALAFAWPFAKEPIAGVTPVVQMLESFEPGSTPKTALMAGTLRPREPLRLDGRSFGRVVVARNPAEAKQAVSRGTLVLTPVATPVFVSGMSRSGLKTLERLLEPYNLVPMSGPGRLDRPVDAPLVPGAAVGAQLVGGDIDITAVGTLTYINQNKMIAFGHPFMGLGAVDLPLTSAYVYGVLPSAEVSFKLASPIRPVGRISEDRNWCIGGVVGDEAKVLPAEFSLKDMDRSVDCDYKIQVIRHKDLTPSLVYESLLMAIGSLAPPTEGSAQMSLEIVPRGLPTIRRENLFAQGGRETAFEMLFADPFTTLPIGELMEYLDMLTNNRFGPIPVEHLKVQVAITQKRHTAHIERLFADKKRVRSGETVTLGVVLQPFGEGKRTEEVKLTIPPGLPPGRLQIGVSGGKGVDRLEGMMGIQRPDPKDLSQMLDRISNREKNNDLVVRIALPTVGMHALGRELPGLPNSVIEVLQASGTSGFRVARDYMERTIPTSWVLSGSEMLTLTLETDEKDKAGAFPTPGVTFPWMEDLGGFFEGIFRYGMGPEGALSSRPDTGGERAAAVGGWRRMDLPRAMQAEDRGPGVPVAEGSDVESMPEMPSWEEIESLSSQDVESIGFGEEGGGRRLKGLARPVSVWSHTALKDFTGGKFFGTAVTSRGDIILSPSVMDIMTTPDQCLWAAVRDGKGDLYLGSWTDGSVIRVSPDGKSERVLSTGDIAVPALTADSAGNLYAAALPSGNIYRLIPTGESKVFCQLPEPYIWNLTFDRGGALWAGTGPHGKVFRISPSGEVRLAFEAPDRHIMALALSGETVYLGTYPKGKVYRIGKEGHAEPFFEVPKGTVQSLTVDAEGSLYVGTSPKAQVYRLRPDGQAMLLFESAMDKHVFAMAVDREGNLYASTGPRGRVYRIMSPQVNTVLYDPKTLHTVSLVRDGDQSLYGVTVGSGRVFRLTMAGEAAGEYLSSVQDAGAIARWGQIRWEQSAGEGTSVEIQTRTGNTAYPDATWSDWSSSYTRFEGQNITSPPAQYLQYRVRLKAAGPARPVLRRVQIFYLTKNRPPEVTISAPAKGDIWAGTKSIRWAAKDPDKEDLVSEVFYSGDGGKTWVQLKSEAEKPKPSPAGKKGGPIGPKKPAAPKPAPRPKPAAEEISKEEPAKEARPEPSAPSESENDQGSARKPPSLKRPKPGAAEEEPAQEEQAREPLEVRGEIKTQEFSWDTKKVKDGRYLVKVVVSDRNANPDDPLSAEAISPELGVDNTPPVLTVDKARRPSDPAPISLLCRDAGSYVAGAEYRVDKEEWIAATAQDGLFDSPEETIRLDPKRLPAGKHILQIRIRDAVGNEKTEKIPYGQTEGKKKT